MKLTYIALMALLMGGCILSPEPETKRQLPPMVDDIILGGDKNATK